MFGGLKAKLSAKKETSCPLPVGVSPLADGKTLAESETLRPTSTSTPATTTTTGNTIDSVSSSVPSEAQQAAGKKRTRDDAAMDSDSTGTPSLATGGAVHPSVSITAPPPPPLLSSAKIVDVVVSDLPYLEEQLWTHDELREYTKIFLVKATEALKSNAAKAGRAGCAGRPPICIVPVGLLQKVFCNDLPTTLEKMLLEGTDIFSGEPVDMSGNDAAAKFMKVHSPCSDSGTEAHTPHDEAVLRELRVKVETMNALWHLTTFHLRETIRQKWSYDVYLARHNALGEEARINRGTVIATARDVIGDVWSSHTSIMSFIVLLLRDCVAQYEVNTCAALVPASSAQDSKTVKERPGKNSSAEGEKQQDPEKLPTEIVEGVRRMMRYTQKKKYSECKQQYVDMTMGVANWCLGLFSGGEMHMRRSLEKIERGRVFHVLNNDKAISILHAVRDVTSYVERNESAFASLGHFTFVSADTKEC